MTRAFLRKMNYTHIHFKSISSTHLYAIEQAGDLKDQTVITAEFQSDGRGRFGREWISAPGDSLLMTIFLKLCISPSRVALILPVTALAVLNLLKDFRIETTIRWPNDVMVGEKKIAGLLAESSFIGNRLSHVVVSVGLNVNQDTNALTKIDRPATSIFVEMGRFENSLTLMSALLSHFDKLYNSLLANGFTAIVEQWREKQMLSGKRVRIEAGGRWHEGRVASFGNDGSIAIEDDTGIVKSFVAGEVHY